MKLSICVFLFTISAAMLAIPAMTRRGIVFGFAVPPDFRRSDRARRSVAQFRALVVSALLIALGALLFAPDTLLAPISIISPLLILLAGGIGFLWQRRNVAPFAVQPERQRVVDLTNTPERLPWFIWLAPGPFAILAAAAVALSRNWQSIPASFPVHWTFNGQPDRWSNRTASGVYGVLVFAAELCAWMLVMGLATWFGARRSRLRGVTLASLIAVEYMIACLFAAMALRPILQLDVPFWLVLWLPLLFLAPVIISMTRAFAEPRDAEPTPNECWKAGMIYYNPNDPALLVEKRTGIGYTFNFGNYWSWILALGLLLVIATAKLLL